MAIDDFHPYLADFLGDDGRTAALLLDFDGTLAPLVAQPEQATLPQPTKEILHRLSQLPNVFLAVISGRAVEDVRERVGLPGITYAGNHGLDIVYPDKHQVGQYRHQCECIIESALYLAYDSFQFSPSLPDDVMERSQALAKRIEAECCRDGASLENKGVILAYHYRNVEEQKRDQLVCLVKQLIKSAGFRVGLAKCAVESRPQLNWGKGRAAFHILNTHFGQDWTDR